MVDVDKAHRYGDLHEVFVEAKIRSAFVHVLRYAFMDRPIFKRAEGRGGLVEAGDEVDARSSEATRVTTGDLTVTTDLARGGVDPHFATVELFADQYMRSVYEDDGVGVGVNDRCTSFCC